MISRFISDWKRRQGMAFREVLVTQVREVLRAWLAGAGKRPAARRAGVDVKTANRYIHAARAAGVVRDGDESQLTDELLGVAAAVHPARPAGHGPSWEVLAPRQAEIVGRVKEGLTLVKIGEMLERSGTAVPYRTLARFAAPLVPCSWQMTPVAGDALQGAGDLGDAGSSFHLLSGAWCQGPDDNGLMPDVGSRHGNGCRCEARGGWVDGCV